MGFNIVKRGATDADHEYIGWYRSLDGADFYNETEYFTIESDSSVEYGVYDPSNGGSIVTDPTRKREELAAEVRAKRDQLISETDWWASSDLTMTQAQIDYRQALRNISSQSGFPETVTWPTKP
jgi:antitoxin component of MazEF toxin-antitoxin module